MKYTRRLHIEDTIGFIDNTASKACLNTPPEKPPIKKTARFFQTLRAELNKHLKPYLLSLDNRTRFDHLDEMGLDYNHFIYTGVPTKCGSGRVKTMVDYRRLRYPAFHDPSLCEFMFLIEYMQGDPTQAFAYYWKQVSLYNPCTDGTGTLDLDIPPNYEIQK